jgi:hypothetical protein
MLTTTGRELKFIQIVASGSSPARYSVRGFEGGLITCECEGYKHRSKCKHQALGLAQEQAEQVNWDSWLASQGLDTTHEGPALLVDNGPTDFDAHDSQAVKAAGRKAMQELFGEAA